MKPTRNTQNYHQCQTEGEEQKEFDEFLRNTPFSSNTTDEEKRLVFQKSKTKKKIEDIKEKTVEKKRKNNADYCKKYRKNKKLKIETSQKLSKTENNISSEPIPKRLITEPILADNEFTKRFYDNKFGFACSVCDRLWFKNDLRNIPQKSMEVLHNTFVNENILIFKVCQTCYKALNEKKIPRLSRSNGFTYPEYPVHLPTLDIITERLVSPRIPFMQIRRLRFINGSKSIVGQVINVPVDVNQMVHELPRQLDDDYAFNVHIKRHQIHKSPYLVGLIKKANVKAWLKYLLDKPLYKLYKIQVNNSFFQPTTIPILPTEEDVDTDEPIIESIFENSDNVQNILLAKQHTLMWSEEKYLDMAPGMKNTPMSLIYDEHAEELSFPSIYLGEARLFSIQNVTPFMMAFSEIRRKDRRGVKPEHILYMAMKIMRLRVAESLYITFKSIGAIKNITRADIEDKHFLENSMEHNLLFLKSIPNSIQYWVQRKKDVFAMIRQLGKPTLFTTLSASEYGWSDLLKILFKLQHGCEFEGSDPAIELSSDKRTNLVNEDPVTCCIYFDKLIDTIMYLLQSSRYSPFEKFRMIDYFKRIEFQQRGSPHAHILLWLENDPKEIVSEDMHATIQLVDKLCSIDPDKIKNVRNQIHKHTFTCYKRAKDEERKICRFGAPFWPMKNTTILIPMPKEDGRREILKNKYADMHHSLEFKEFEDMKSFLEHHRINTYEHYLNVLRAGIKRPRIFLKRTIKQRWINNFNPWVANILNSNMDIQYILEPYSCATYVVEYVNKTNRGISTLHKDLIKLRDEYPDKDYSEILRELGIKMLNSVEMSSQEAAWYLLNLHMSEASRKVTAIPTCWPHERQRIRKSSKQMEEEEIAKDSLDIWKEDIIQKYEHRPLNLESISLAQFVAWYYQTKTKRGYKRRMFPKIIRYRNYDMNKLDEYKREMVLLHVPFRNEETELLDKNKFILLYNVKETEILEARKEFESEVDINNIIEYCNKMCINEDDANSLNEQNQKFIQSKAINDDIIQALRDGNNDDIRLAMSEKISCIVRKRENVMTAGEYCAEMRKTNLEQKDLILEAIHRIFNENQCTPLQIFLTGPAGSGKTFTMKLLMETFNRFSQQQNSTFNAFIASASTGMAAAAINGTTVHSVFRISNSKIETGISIETLNSFRTVFPNVQIIFIDECSMIGSGLLQQINNRLQHIFCNYDFPFARMNMVLCGDLNQLPPVYQTPIYQRSKYNFSQDIVWQSLEYYPLVQVMRQADSTFSGILTKIGNGKNLTAEETISIESRFFTKEYVDEYFPEAIRLFHKTIDVVNYNKNSISGENMIEYIAQDIYSGYSNSEQLASARRKVHKLTKVDETGGLPYMLKLLIGKPYMIRTNIDVQDGLVNGAIGTLRNIERDINGHIKRLWLSFIDAKVGKIIQAKYDAIVRSNEELQRGWVPISLRNANIHTNSAIINCKRTQFPLVEASAITIHKSQGSTYDTVIYNYNKDHDQQLVYVAMSRATCLEGLYLTNNYNDFKFYHARGRINVRLANEFQRLENHRLVTIGHISREFIARGNNYSTGLSLCTFNVQNLRAHYEDLATDFVLSKVRIMALSETWVENETPVYLQEYKRISQFKRHNVLRGGVCIFEKKECSSVFQSIHHELLKFDVKSRQIQKIPTVHDAVGDICAIETIINNKKTLLITVYITPGTSSNKLEEFFTFNLLAYSHKRLDINKIDKIKLSKIPIIICGDFNVNMSSDNGVKFITFMRDNFDLKINNNPAISTTRNNTCIDAVFTRYTDCFETINYISYFSYHKPLLSISYKISVD